MTTTKPDVVLALVLETVENMFAREFCRPPDQALLALARSDRLGRVIVADPWRSWPVDVLKRRPLSRVSSFALAGRSVERIRPRRLVRQDPKSIGALNRSYEGYARQVGRLAGLDRHHKAVLVSCNPFASAFAKAPWIGGQIYVGQDDFAHGPGTESWWPAYEYAQTQLGRFCDSVFAVSRELADRIAGQRGQVMPNGIDADLWDPDRRGDDTRWSQGGPYAVYAGSVEGRVDDSLFAEVLKVVPRVVVAGPCFDADQKRRLEAMAGVELTGSLDQHTLVDVIRGASVGLIPHHDTPMTRAMSPLKMYEYLAGGLPVVATDLPPMADGGSRVLLCRDRGEWASTTAAALALGREDREQIRRTIERISWSGRMEPLIDAILASHARR